MTEADYICFLAKNISRGLYQNGGFYVLPYFSPDKKAVYFPDLDYSFKFWNLIKKTKAQNLDDEFPTPAVDEVASKLKNQVYSKIIKKDGLTINLLETEFGTLGSYFVKNNIIYLTQRVGNSKVDFERTLLLAKLKIKNRNNVEIGEIGWHKREAVAEYFYGLKETKLKIEEIDGSTKYLKKLGFDIKTEIDINNPIFTNQEISVLEKLTKDSGKVIDFDQIGDILWGDKVDDKFSLEAMAKVIENLRKKIKKLGIMKEMIFTKRGKGYFIG